MNRQAPADCYAAELPARLESAADARRLVGRAVADWGLDGPTGEDGARAVSELVTNAVLHAGTPVTVRIRRLGSGVRVEVGDGSPRLPVVEAARPEDLLENRSMTGRGLALVAATCDRWGAEPAPGVAGKVTWAEVGTGRRRLAEQPPPAFPPPARTPEEPGRVEAVTGGGRRVKLVGVPVSVILESTRQLTDLKRELQVMAMVGTAPPEVEGVIQAGRPWVGDIGEWADRERRLAERAAAAGRETVDFEVPVPSDVGTRMEGIATWLRRAAAGIAGRHLLSLPASRQVAAYRCWYREEVERQLAGAEPRPCPVRVPNGA